MPRFVETGRLARGALLAGLALSVTGCVVEPANPYPPVPAPRVEVVPPAPARAVVWQPGHYQWNGAAYVWVPGRYIARTGGRWVRGHWQRAGGGWVWVRAHWQ
jgi:hypothetical protein